MNGLWALLLWFRGFLLGRACLATENLALRQQLSVLHRQSRRPRHDDRDRRFWLLMKMFWPRWREVLQIVTPETVVRWHRHGFHYYWRWISRSKGGRKRIDQEIRELIQRMARENPTWGAPRIHSELTLLGDSVAESTVAKYMPPPSRRPAMSWNTFLRAHLHETVGIDFLTVPTATIFRPTCLATISFPVRKCNCRRTPTATAGQRSVRPVGGPSCGVRPEGGIVTSLESE